MKYTLTRANQSADQYPKQSRELIDDITQAEIDKNVFMAKLSDLTHAAANWGRKTHFGRLTSVPAAAMLNMPPL